MNALRAGCIFSTTHPFWQNQTLYSKKNCLNNTILAYLNLRQLLLYKNLEVKMIWNIIKTTGT